MSYNEMSYNDVYNRYMQEANAYAQQYGLDPSTAHNGAWDAFRHAYSSAEMAREYGSAAAHAAGELNEIRGDYKHDQPSYERNMDEWNNAAGREIGKNSTSSAESAQRVYDALKKGDLITDPIVDPRDYKDTWDKIKDQMRDWWDRAQNWVWPRDPIILDLDGDGLETVGLASNVYFDHDGDGVLTKTGWAGKDDALLVWDRNTNGSIDTGAELFGDFTVLPNGTLAPNGFAALAALDSNGDGILDASDPAFAELKLWRDTSQDGQTGTGELISLADAGVVSLNLANTLKTLPTMGGAGNVRELRQATASLTGRATNDQAWRIAV